MRYKVGKAEGIAVLRESMLSDGADEGYVRRITGISQEDLDKLLERMKETMTA